MRRLVLGARVLAWLSEHRVRATPEFVFSGIRGPLTAIAKKLGISEATTRKHLRAAGQVDDPARAHALTARGGRRLGGRPSNPLDDADLAAAWSKKPNISSVARHLHVSRKRVRVRLQQLELLPPPRHRKIR